MMIFHQSQLETCCPLNQKFIKNFYDAIASSQTFNAPSFITNKIPFSLLRMSTVMPVDVAWFKVFPSTSYFEVPETFLHRLQKLLFAQFLKRSLSAGATKLISVNNAKIISFMLQAVRLNCDLNTPSIHFYFNDLAYRWFSDSCCSMFFKPTSKFFDITRYHKACGQKNYY